MFCTGGYFELKHLKFIFRWIHNYNFFQQKIFLIIPGSSSSSAQSIWPETEFCSRSTSINNCWYTLDVTMIFNFIIPHEMQTLLLSFSVTDFSQVFRHLYSFLEDFVNMFKSFWNFHRFNLKTNFLIITPWYVSLRSLLKI